ncbi:hypothetical protein [Streptomyces sp. NPDC001530]|uniref:hypothetical protein n=1 Tax=Streptomyces sp. NPDC001530 TaxID=3364582 RepID=UPI0036C99C0A
MSAGEVIGRAFERSEVTLDVFSLTSESLDAHVRLQAERIGAREIAPERIALRVLLPSEGLDLPYPRARDDAEDPRPQERLREIRRRHTESLRRLVQDLKVWGLPSSVSLEMRSAPLTPAFRLWLLNGTEVLFAPYEAVERVVVVDDGEEIEVIDVLGLGATCTHHISDDDPYSQGSVFVSSMQAWFDSVWKLLAR